jgi:hypothetical protein
MNKMAMMRPLHTAFQSKRDEKTDRNREEMKEEIADTVHRRVRGMNVEHHKPRWKGWRLA